MARYQKKKRKGLAVALFTAAVVLFGAGTCFAYPYIETAISPKTQVLTSLKAAGEESQTEIRQAIQELTGLLTEQTQVNGEVTVSKAQFDQTDCLKELGFDKASFQMQMNAKKQSVSGNVQAEGGNDKQEAEVYIDRGTLKEFLKESGYGVLYQDIDRVLNSVDAETMKEYMEVAEKLTEHLQPAVAMTLNRSLYEKNGKETLEISGQQLAVTSYTVTITKEALLAGIEEFLNQVYSDTELSSYTTMFATFTGYSKYDLSKIAEERFADMTGVRVAVYLDKEKKPVRIATEFDTGFCYVVMETQGTGNWNEQMALRITTQRSQLTVIREKADQKQNFDISARYHEENQEPYASVALKLEKDQDRIVCTEGKLSAKYRGHQAEAAFYGECTYQIDTQK